MPLQIKHLDFRFENSLVKAVANRNYPETKLAGLTVGPFEEGNEYEIYHWVAEKLAEARNRPLPRRRSFRSHRTLQGSVERTCPSRRANQRTPRRFLPETPQIPQRHQERSHTTRENAGVRKIQTTRLRHSKLTTKKNNRFILRSSTNRPNHETHGKRRTPHLRPTRKTNHQLEKQNPPMRRKGRIT